VGRCYPLQELDIPHIALDFLPPPPSAPDEHPPEANVKPIRLAVALVVLVGIALLVRATSNAASNPDPQGATLQDEGTRRMVERLRLIADGIVDVAAQYEDRARPADFRERLAFEETLGYELLLAGHTEEAIATIQGLEALLRSEPGAAPAGSLDRIRYQLAVANLRLGEQENCVLNHAAAACILPFDESAVHTRRRGSETAIEIFSEVLARDPDDLPTRWLLNLAYMTLGMYPAEVPSRWLIPPAAFASEYDIKPFRDVAPQLGIAAVGLSGGSITEDFSGTGFLDIMVSSSGLRDQLRLFRNNGDGTFTERTYEAGLEGIIGGLNLIHADYDNDGFPDVFVLRGGWWGSGGRHPNSLLRNNGDGTFSDVTEAAGLLSFHPTQTAAWGDYDNDGWLDLYIGNESTPTERHSSQLFRNNRDGTFTNVAQQAGVAFRGYVKGVSWGDYNNDGLLDLYVSNYGGPNLLFRNDGPDASGRWRFTDVAREAGVTEPVSSFPVWFWDYDNDGWQDLLVLPFDAGIISGTSEALGAPAAEYLGLPVDVEMPRLYRNNRDGTFSDVTRAARLDRVMYAMGSNLGDLDNDGYLDIYIGTGAPDFRTVYPNRMFRNAEGRFFQDVTSSGRFGHLQKGHGVSFADIDNDGDQDVHAVIGGAYEGDAFQNVLFENPGHGNRWITLRLEGVTSNRSAIGARLKLTVETEDGPRHIHATVGTGGSFGSSSLRQEIGLGQAQSLSRIEVFWPATRTTQRFENVPMDRFYAVREGDPVLHPLDARPFRFR
jgi:hypothetical protein